MWIETCTNKRNKRIGICVMRMVMTTEIDIENIQGMKKMNTIGKEKEILIIM